MENEKPLRLLLLDDDDPARAALDDYLRGRGFNVISMRHGPQATARIRDEAEPFDVVLTELSLPNMYGIDVVEVAAERGAGTQVVMLASFSALDKAIECIGDGATDYITKPFKFSQIEVALNRAADRKRLSDANQKLEERVQSLYSRLDLLKENRDKLDRFIRETSERMDDHGAKLDDCVRMLQKMQAEGR